MKPIDFPSAGPLGGGVRWLLQLALCSAYLLGGTVKLLDFPGAISEMRGLGLPLPEVLAAATILVELGAPLLILSGRFARASAVCLALFTIAATLAANRFWQLDMPQRWMERNAFFEHLGLAAAFLLLALRA